jgi:hypothetical protein
MCVTLMISCTNSDQKKIIQDVYVTDFISDETKNCRASDVDLSNSEVQQYFLIAKKVDHKTIHDHYNYGDCHIEGTLTYDKNNCTWEIRSGSTGHIKCGGKTQYFICDTCEKLFQQ